ncbi:hypothetical protein CkaCkLH20_07645 [Colletotrichum karsti]|uniref:C2H2-type domain-containing protein n=1 Tax=Colletotrichum karsti TaxID=1095194 RepID=A0A9P6LJ81_9PEZI|nr:uncharacterized protein CkaCkLH20_07645 [Colletotrichum karsti]KAF9874951.1 hypothetical protein CkaCkLH20_07645 [Colletotrichum karsti]
MTSPFWHTQHGVSSPLWQTQPTAPRRPERPDRPDAPSSLTTSRSNTPSRRTRIETQYRPPAPSPTSRPPIRSRYTSPADELKTKTSAPSKLPRHSSGSPERVYSSSSQPYECRSPVMTLRILSPSRHGVRDEKEHNVQGNQPVKESPEPPLPTQGLSRSTNTKLTSPKRRRFPLRDSILLKRKDSPEASKPPTPTSATAPKEAPETPEHRTGAFGRASLPPTPTTPSKSRLKGFSRLGAFSRDSKLARPPEYRQSEQLPRRDDPKSQANGPSDAASSAQLVSRICTIILDEGLGARLGADRSTTALKVWDAVVKCLDDVSKTSNDTASKPKHGLATIAKVSESVVTAAANSKNPWPLEAWGFRHGRKKDVGVQDRLATELARHGDMSLDAKDVPQVSTNAENKQEAVPRLPHLQLPCPFRARNPSRFNVTDSWHCAQGYWKSLTELQKHIARHHRHQSDAHLFQCPRCEKGFSEPNAFKEHLMLPREQMCDPRSEVPPISCDPEDGITAGRARALSEGVEHGKIGSWDDMWKCLFPADRVVPRPVFLPAIELPQVEQEVFASDNMADLKTSLEERLRFLAAQSANSDLFSAQIPVITGSISLVVEAHLRSVFIGCRAGPPTRPNRSRSASQTQETINNRPRKLSSASSVGMRHSELPDQRRPVLAEAKSFTREAPRPQMHNHRSRSEGSQSKLPRAAKLPVPSTLTIPFPRISALTEHSDAAPSHVSEEAIASPKGSDGEYSSGVESNPTSAGGLRDSNNTDIRCSKCNMRPSLRPDEDMFSDPRISASTTHLTHNSSCRFSDSGIGILCRNCRMLEELINSYSRASTQSAKSGRQVEGTGPAPGPGPGLESKEVTSARLVAPFSPDPSVSMDENDEETLFDILESAPYVVEDGQWKSRVVSPKFPPPTQSLPPSPVGRFDRYRHDGNFF